MTDDGFLDLPLERDREEVELSLGLISPPILPDIELVAAEKSFRQCEAPGSNKIVFTSEDEETGAEIFENAETWQRLMGWPRLPTIEEALAWQAWAIATMGAEMFFAIQAARAGASSERPKPPAPPQ
jgi:hypothetical protein